RRRAPRRGADGRAQEARRGTRRSRGRARGFGAAEPVHRRAVRMGRELGRVRVPRPAAPGRRQAGLLVSSVRAGFVAVDPRAPGTPRSVAAARSLLERAPDWAQLAPSAAWLTGSHARSWGSFHLGLRPAASISSARSSRFFFVWSRLAESIQ